MTIAVTSLCVSIACRESEADAPTPTPPYVIIAQFVTNYSMTLYAPNGSYDAYRNDWHWDNFESTEGLVFTQEDNVTFAIPATNLAVAYTVNVYADEEMTELVATTNLDAEETSTSKLKPLHLSIDRFENGRYYYDVVAQLATGKTLRNLTGAFAIDVTGIDGVDSDCDATEVARYDIYGRLLTEPTPGINIVIYSDGTSKKIIID